MALTIVDFIEQVNGLTVDDVPPKVRKRINNALADLDGGSSGSSVDNADSILVSKTDEGDYSSIQAAVDSVGADETPTIFVEGGTYEEQVIVNTDLSIQGLPGAEVKAPQDRDAFDIPESDDSIIPVVFAFGGSASDSDDDAATEVTGSDTVSVDVDGLVVNGGDRAFSGGDYFGVALRNVNGTVSDGEIKNMTTGNGVSGGISVRGDSSVDILNNRVTDYERIGIVGDGDGSSDVELRIEDNYVEGTGPNGGWAPNGIQMGIGSSGDVLGNTVVDHRNQQADPGGILAFGSTDVRIANNEVRNNDNGIQVYGDFFFGTGEKAFGTTVESNRIEKNDLGMYIGSKSENTTVKSNQILDNAEGVSIGQRDGYTVTIDTIGSNTFEDTEDEFDVRSYVADPDDIVDLQTVQGNNKFDPSGEISGNSIVPNNAVLVSQSLDGRGGFTNVQDAIDGTDPQNGASGATVGDTVFVEPGTYEEHPVVDETNAITVQGTGDGVVIDASADSSSSNSTDEPYGFAVETNDVTLENFTLKGPVQGSDEYPDDEYGLKIAGAENVTVEDVTVEGASLVQVDLNGVIGAELRNVTADGSNNSSSSTPGTGLFLTNCEDVVLEGITTRNNDWGGIAVSAWDSDGSIGTPTARDIQLTGENRIEDRPILYTEEQPGGDSFHQTGRNNRNDTDGDSEWDVSFPLDGTVGGSAVESHDVTEATINTGSGSSGSLSYTLTFERDNPAQIGELYFIEETERDDRADTLSGSSGDGEGYSVLGRYNIS